ncbi:hypothetical protein DL770_010987 [Monosporascus sp. CRB-9-2]|nr:hypothetical protein DL770_010987 [Monosporascus sp. CRB-9-2]
MASARTRFGTLAIFTLLGGLLIVAAGAGFISFLWYGTADNHVWRRIILNNWATRAVTLTSIALRIAVVTQGSVCLSMLAAIALEKSKVPLDSVGSISMVRAGGDKGLLPTLVDFAWPMLRRGPRLDQLILPTVLLTAAIMALSQFISTALLSDVVLRLFPGYNKTVQVGYDYAYYPDRGFFYTMVSSSSLWEANPPTSWPMFAEYYEPPIVQDNVSDTGLSLRAFLPLAANERRLVRNYSGMALVLDSRVTCQRPVLEDIRLSSSWISGRVRPSTSTPRLDEPGRSVEFLCAPPDPGTICELNAAAITIGDFNQFSGGLVSEFREFPTSPGQNKSGAAFLILFQPQYSFADRPEFVAADLGDWPFVASLCYTSLDVADRWIDAFSDTNRTEPTTSWINSSSFYDFSFIATQLTTGGHDNAPSTSYNPKTVEERGIMRFQPSADWSGRESSIPLNDGPGLINMSTYLPFLTGRLHLQRHPESAPFGYRTESNGLGNQSAFVVPFDFPFIELEGHFMDKWISQLFEDFLTNQSLSTALQAVITSLAGIEYYAHLGLFNKFANVSTVSFVTVQTPGGQFGQKRAAAGLGFIAVMTLLAVHTALVTIVSVRFWVQASDTRIGDDWQAIAQVALSDVNALRDGMQRAKGRAAQRDIIDDCGKRVHVCLDDKTSVVALADPNKYVEVVKSEGN